MADQLRNMPKATRIGGKGSIRRKVKSSREGQVPPNIGAALKSFKRQVSHINDVGSFALEYEDSVQIFMRPEVKIIMADKKTPVVYVVTGKNIVESKKKEAGKNDDVNKSTEKQNDAPSEEAPPEDNKEAPNEETPNEEALAEDNKEVGAEHEVPEIEDID